ncbi:SusD/RagB family nutrient-binding outer membrane lipoprotein [Agriterribacter sp.]|uniref:SusD/RagB family nutrient-binding outer membrane lipoprotein n=1 Tax=Agriterribacter sp. TaxID=2821509 RepID=UPI002C660C76|nr:SusD/RagB family nutrient-binding outer membrane lipoprotein [Agriterribacter sp.]HRP58196.1 SusD/RagB family nutrient-binding outer membrane lipoprotein [Agriterribacter sp.]
MKKFITYIIAVIIVSVLASCSKFLDVNENPNAPSDVPVEQVLPNTLVSSVNIEIIGISNSPGVSGSLNQLGSVWGGYWAKATDGPSAASLFLLEETYAVEAMASDRDGRNFWEDIYKILTNYRNIETKATQEGDLAYAGIAKIMQGWHFMRLVDLYNNVPFDEALQGTDNATPAFEDGQAVYEKSVNLVTAGIADIKSAAPFSKHPAADDILFTGDLARWIKFANTIKLRALLRQSQTGNTGYINAELAKIAAEGSGFLSAGESAEVNPGYIGGSAGLQNPLWETYYRTAVGALTPAYNTIRPTAFLINEYKRLNDPRLENLYTRAEATGEYTGVPLGTEDAAFSMANTSPFLGPQENGGQPGALFKRSTQSSVLLGSFESLFLQAEAAERGWISVNAKTLYNLAIEESFKYMEATDGYAGYIIQDEVDLDKAGDKIERIIEQKWLSLNTINGFEAWNDYRRLGIPAIPQSLRSPNADPAYRPLRLTYRKSELTGNGEEVAEQGTVDPFASAVFWDQ